MAKEAAILMSDDIPPGMKKALVKPLAREKRQWTKATWQPVGFGPDPNNDRDVEGEAFMQGPLQNMLTQLVQKKKKNTTDTPATPSGAAPPNVRKRLLFVTPTKSKATPKTRKGRHCTRRLWLRPSTGESYPFAKTPPWCGTVSLILRMQRFNQWRGRLARRQVAVLPKQINYYVRSVGWILTRNWNDVWMARTTKRNRPLQRNRRSGQCGGKFLTYRTLFQDGERLKRGDPAINRLDKIAKMHDIDYAKLWKRPVHTSKCPWILP